MAFAVTTPVATWVQARACIVVPEERIHAKRETGTSDDVQSSSQMTRLYAKSFDAPKCGFGWHSTPKEVRYFHARKPQCARRVGGVQDLPSAGSSDRMLRYRPCAEPL
jgi:hypothetical protein